MPDDHTYEAWDLEALSDLPNYQDWIIRAFRPYLRGDAVEIGAGTGTFTESLRACVDRLELVEPAPNLFRQLEERFSGDDAMSIVANTVEDYLANAGAATCDSVVLVNVLEHIEDDDVAIAGLFHLLRPGGHLFLFVPALPGLFSAMDTALGHYRRYRKGELVRLVRSAGFEPVTERYFDLLGVVPWWIVYTLGRRTRFDPGMSKLYDRVAVPVGRTLEALFPPPFGKNVLLIARKPGNGPAP